MALGVMVESIPIQQEAQKRFNPTGIRDRLLARQKFV